MHAYESPFELGKTTRPRGPFSLLNGGLFLTEKGSLQTTSIRL